MLTAPFFYLIEKDYLGKFSIEWMYVDWHTESRFWGPRWAKLYRRSTKSLFRRAMIDFVLMGWQTVCEALSRTMDVVLQVLVITMCSKWVSLVKLVRYSESASRLFGLEPTRRACGLRELPCGSLRLPRRCNHSL